MARRHPVYLISFLTRLWPNVYLVCDLAHVHIRLFLDITQSSLNEPSPLQALHHGIDHLKVLGHLRLFHLS